MAKRKRTKGQTTIYIIRHRKRKIEQHKPTKNRGEFRCFGRVSSSCSTSDTRLVTVKPHENHLIWKSCWTRIKI